ncbi:hypothetical protein ACPRNU_16250 [Chromobacterium vaccinii]|uniref:hypothetical protein n=1 Tax=Chromobacterium vaccinii TaxID=1108595 RepID=UPI003C7795CC
MEARENYEFGEDSELCRMPMAPVTPRDSAMQALRDLEGRPVMARRTTLATVESLQARVLSSARLAALADIQDAIGVLAETAGAINRLIALQGLPLHALSMPQPGMMWHAIETMLAESRVAAAQLERGGLPLRAEQQTAAARGRAA